VEQRLNDIRQGKGRAGWEGEWPAPAVADAAWKTATETLPGEAPTPSVVPTEEGGIEFMWGKGGWHIELEVCGDSQTLLWMWNRRGDGWGLRYIPVPLGEGRARLRAVLGELALR
jgi:hypothetical protein